MGLAMANNLQRHLVAKKVPGILYTNRTLSRGNPLQALGGTPESSFEKVVGQCGIIFTMVLASSLPSSTKRKKKKKKKPDPEVDIQRHRSHQPHLLSYVIRP